MTKEKSIYESLGEERKKLQEEGLLPDWFTTGGYQLFKEKYEFDVAGRSFRGQAERIARTAARHLPESKVWEERFFTLIWNGWLSCSTPVLSNMGTDRGMPVSCSGTLIGDSVSDFYYNLHEIAMLSKYGFGTASYLGDIRPRGESISKGGKASGVMPVLNAHVQCSRDISQGSTRRGAWAGYIPIDHGDALEVMDLLETEPDDVNIGWCISDEFIKNLTEGDEYAMHLWSRALKIKCTTGKGYFFFPDKVNRARPAPYIEHDLFVKTSQLCTEITLFSDESHTFTCVLSSMNVAKRDEWKDTDAIFWATVFLDCVAEEFIQKANGVRGLEKAVRYTKKARSLGLGVCGFHTYLQSKMIPFESFEAHSFNNILFKELHDNSLLASMWMAKELGEPEWCVGHGVRNTHRLAVAPTMSTALIMGGVSQGIEPVLGNVFTQASAGGEMERVNPVFLKLMKDRNKFTKAECDRIAMNNGSVQNLDWLTEEEKFVFRTAFEIDQRAVLRLAATRQRWIDQTQSLNLFFAAEEKEEYIAEIHQEAFLDENIHSLYYLRSMAGVIASKGECEACQ